MTAKNIRDVVASPIMQPTPYRQRWIRRQVRKIAKQIGLSMPRVIFSPKVLERVVITERDKRQARMFATKVAGFSFDSAHVVYVNIDPHYMQTGKRRALNLTELLDTITHELVHLRWWWMSHGKRFNKRIQQVKNGKQWKPRHKER